MNDWLHRQYSNLKASSMKELCDHQIDIDCKKVVFMYHQNQNVLSLKSDGLANQFLRFFIFSFPKFEEYHTIFTLSTHTS